MYVKELHSMKINETTDTFICPNVCGIEKSHDNIFEQSFKHTFRPSFLLKHTMYVISLVTNHKSTKIFLSLPAIEVGFSANLYEVNEDDGTAIFTIQRRGILQRSASINFFAISGEGDT